MHLSIQRLAELDLPLGNWALFGSGPLLLRGWIDEVGDLDVVSRGPAWEKAKEHGRLVALPDGNQIVEAGSGVTVGRTWLYGDFTIDDLIDTAEMIDGIPCVRLEHVISYKRLSDRPKDRVHLEIIESKAP